MNPVFPQTVYENEEDRQTARILFMLILGAWVAYGVVIFIGLYYRDWNSVAMTLGCSILQIAPLELLRRGHLRVSNLIFVLSILGAVTAIATVGQGIRDIAVLSFPVIFILASLTLNRTIFILCVGLTLASMGWLIFGEANGWYVPQLYEMSSWINFSLVGIILLGAAVAIDLLATNMRKSLEQARQEIVQRKHMEEQLRYQSTHDTLTGIYNRAFFEAELMRFEMSRDFPVSVIVADVDKLKLTNDMQGHVVGDELLRCAANVLRSVFRSNEVLARIGGDEFAVLLPTTDAVAAEQMLARVRDCQSVQNTLHPDLPVQLSLGTATAETNDLMRVFTIADQRMYADKAARKLNSGRSTLPGFNQSLVS